MGIQESLKMDQTRKEARYQDKNSTGRNPLHGKPSDNDAKGMGRGGKINPGRPRNAATETEWSRLYTAASSGKCNCGCGQTVELPKTALKPSARALIILKQVIESGFTNKPHRRKAWENRNLRDLAELIPMCKCGCGLKIHVPVTTLQQGRGCFDNYLKKTSGYRSECKHLLLKLEAPYCLCGCEERIKPSLSRIRESDDWRKFKQTKYINAAHAHAHKYIKPRDRGFLEFPELEGLVCGSLLGDSSISMGNKNSHNPRVTCTHGVKQKEYCRYKSERLRDIGARFEDEFKNAGFGEKSVRFITKSHPALYDTFQLLRPAGGKKVVTRGWLDKISDEGMAWWYMVDGSIQGYTISLHTEGFSLAENEIITEWLRDKGIEASVKDYIKKNKRYHYLYLDTIESIKFLEIVSKYQHESMAYKFPADYLTRKRKR